MLGGRVRRALRLGDGCRADGLNIARHVAVRTAALGLCGRTYAGGLWALLALTTAKSSMTIDARQSNLILRVPIACKAPPAPLAQARPPMSKYQLSQRWVSSRRWPACIPPSYWEPGEGMTRPEVDTIDSATLFPSYTAPRPGRTGAGRICAMEITKPGRARVARRSALVCRRTTIAGEGASTGPGRHIPRPHRRERRLLSASCRAGLATGQTPGGADGGARSHAHARRAPAHIQLTCLCGVGGCWEPEVR